MIEGTLILRPPMTAETAAVTVVCNASRILEYSDLCVGADPPPDCYPSVKDKPGLVTVAVAFHALNTVLGIGGNLLTLLAIPYARHRRRFGFQGRYCYFTYMKSAKFWDLIPRSTNSRNLCFQNCSLRSLKFA